tara:strand:- start:86 stop:1081 length:996 start_codon:yes stop_codon:yes gene_type:complete
MKSFSFITQKVISQTLKDKFSEVYKVVENAYKFHEQEKTVNPPSYFLRYKGNHPGRIIALPAAFQNETHQAVGIKWISSNPKNLNAGLPRASAVIILNDYETGRPIACLEGSEISSFRTACSAVIGAESIQCGKTGGKTLGIVGTSCISKNILRCFLQRGWTFDSLFIIDLNKEQEKNFKKHFPHLQIQSSPDLTHLITHSNLIVMATSATTPYLHQLPEESSDKVFLNISLRDIGADIILDCNNIVDDIDHVLREETSVHLAYKKAGHKNFISGTIGSLLCTDPFQVQSGNNVIYSPMGLGILDIAVADYIYSLTKKRGDIESVYDFFAY